MVADHQKKIFKMQFFFKICINYNDSSYHWVYCFTLSLFVIVPDGKEKNYTEILISIYFLFVLLEGSSIYFNLMFFLGNVITSTWYVLYFRSTKHIGSLTNLIISDLSDYIWHLVYSAHQWYRRFFEGHTILYILLCKKYMPSLRFNFVLL